MRADEPDGSPAVLASRSGSTRWPSRGHRACRPPASAGRRPRPSCAWPCGPSAAMPLLAGQPRQLAGRRCYARGGNEWVADGTALARAARSLALIRSISAAAALRTAEPCSVVPCRHRVAVPDLLPLASPAAARHVHADVAEGRGYPGNAPAREGRPPWSGLGRHQRSARPSCPCPAYKMGAIGCGRAPAHGGDRHHRRQTGFGAFRRAGSWLPRSRPVAVETSR